MGALARAGGVGAVGGVGVRGGVGAADGVGGLGEVDGGGRGGWGGLGGVGHGPELDGFGVDLWCFQKGFVNILALHPAPPRLPSPHPPHPTPPTQISSQAHTRLIGELTYSST